MSQNDTPCVWLLTNDAVGMRNQVIGLAEAIGWPYELKPINLAKPWRWLPGPWIPKPQDKLAEGFGPLNPPWPDLIISCGRMSAAVALGIKRATGGRTFTVHIQNPQMPLRLVDLILPPKHDNLSGDNVLNTRGALHHVTPEKLQAAVSTFETHMPELAKPANQRPRIVGVLIGGSNATATLTAEKSRALIEQLIAAADEGGYRLWITASRRTGDENIAAMRAALKGTDHWFWDGQSDLEGRKDLPNPYFAILGSADYLIVTGDSVSMVSEAASTGKPVFTIDFDGYSGRLNDFHENLRAEGVTRPFEGHLADWTYEPVNDTPVMAEAVRTRFAAHLKHWNS